MGILHILTKFSLRSLSSQCLVQAHPLYKQLCVAHSQADSQYWFLSRRLLTKFKTQNYLFSSNTDSDLLSHEEETFGTLSQTYSSRAVFRKSSPELQDMKYMHEEEKGRKRFYRGRRHTPYWYFLQCKAKIKEGKLAEALELFEVKMLQEERLQPAESNYTILIGGCGRAGYVKKAFQLYSSMKKRGLVPTDATYTALFNACAESPWKQSGLQHALKLNKELTDKNIEFNLITYRSLLKVYMQNSGLSGSMEILKEISQKFSITTSDTFNILFMGCIKDQELGFRYVLQVWKQMIRMNVKPDINTYNLLLRATRDCGIGDPAKASNVLLHLKDKSIFTIRTGTEEKGKKNRKNKSAKACHEISNLQTPLLDSISVDPKDAVPDFLHVQMNETSHSNSVPSLSVKNTPNLLDCKIDEDKVISLVNVDTPSVRLALIGDLEGIINNMKVNKVSPTIKTFTLLAEIINLDLNSEAILLNNMELLQIRPDLTFFNTLVLKRSKTFGLRSALELFPVMAQNGIAPNIYTFCNLARTCHKKEDGLQLLEDMMTAGYCPNNNIYSTLINVAIKRLDYVYLTDILRDMRIQNVSPNEVVIRQLEFAAQCPPNFDRYQNKNIYLAKIDGFRGYYTRWLDWMDAEEAEHPWKKYRTKSEQDPKTHTNI